MAITAKVFPDNKTSAKISDGSTIVVTKQVVPGEALLKNLTDVDSTDLKDGSILMYRDSTKTFVTTTDLSLSGTLYVTGGNFQEYNKWQQ